MDPETDHVSPGHSFENGARCRAYRARVQRCAGQVEDVGPSESGVTVRGLLEVAASDQGDVAALHERRRPRESCQRRVTMPNGQGEGHACGRSCFGLFGRREIGVSIDVRETDAGASMAGAD
jgi:hypothetical protein